ncbi:MAG: YHS domain-containing protein [Rhodocyclaceae bacterium]|nr:YHS domain-containing protein [Rhodocyclaceae bacterium]
MEWLNQNWMLLVFGIGIFFLMRRGGMGCGHGGSHHSNNAGHANHNTDHGSSDRTRSHEQAIDPVNGRMVDPGHAIASVHDGMPIYFESRENRDRFEAAPEQFTTEPARAERAPAKSCH